MDKIIIGERIRELMVNNNVDKSGLAEDLGITERALYSYLNGDRVPSDVVKYKISRYFNKTVDEIFFDF